MSAAEWTEAHQREAVRRTYELAAAEAGRGDRIAADLFVVEAWGFAASEERWRRSLTICDIDPARIDREVRRVRALAEGRIVRDVTSDRRLRPSPKGLVSVPVRVTRIRRAP